ncbi:MAG: helix-turn-helix transcriptional regulator [Micrococcales bacterium]|nr:helix-turn-helix transcriptional regulator [Micrococcales bacterium]
MTFRPTWSEVRMARPLAEAFRRLEAGTRQSLWNMQKDVRPSFNRRIHDLTESSRARGVDERFVHERSGVLRNPLLTSFEPTARLAPVSTQMLVVDGRYLVVPGAAGRHTSTAFGTADPELVRLGREAFEEVWAASVGWQEAGLLPPLPDRRFQVAVLLLDGFSDREIAERVEVSPRTVSVEIRAIVEWLGARNRTHAIAMLVGAG